MAHFDVVVHLQHRSLGAAFDLRACAGLLLMDVMEPFAAVAKRLELFLLLRLAAAASRNLRR